MKPAEQHREAFGPELAREILRARKLVRLHAGKRDEQSGARSPKAAAETLRIHAIYGFIEGEDLDRDRAEAPACHGVQGQTVQASEGVARQRTAPVSDDVPVVVVPARPHEDDDKTIARRHARIVSINSTS